MSLVCLRSLTVKSFLKKSYLPIGLSILGMPLIETKLFKEISLREETPGVKTSKGIKTVRRNQWGWALVPERKWIPNRGGGGSRESLEADV